MQYPLSSGTKTLAKLTSKGALPPTKLMSGIMKMKDLGSKKHHQSNGYNPFEEDEKKEKRKDKRKRKKGGESSSSSYSSGYERSRKGGVMKLLRRCCGCLCPRPKHPSLSNSVVTHRKISRVASTESLSKESSRDFEKSSTNLLQPRYSAKEMLSNARALNRLQSSGVQHTYTNGDPMSHSDSGYNKPTWPVLPPVAAPRNTLSSSTTGVNSTGNPFESCNSLASPRSMQDLADSPKTIRSTKRPRPTHLSLAVHPAQRKGCSTPTPSGDSPCSTPTTPRTRSGSWALMRASLNNLVKVATHSPRTARASSNSNTEEGGSSVSHEDESEDEIPEATCLRPATGGVHNPARECFGSISLRVLSKQGRWVKVIVCGLSGLPWVGGSGGLMIEVGIEPGGRSQWLVLPHAHGPNINVTLESTVKIPRELKAKHKGLVKVGVWICGRVWRHASLGYALVQPIETQEPVILPLLHRSQLTDNIGQVEISLRCDYADDLTSQVVGSAQAEEVTLTIEVLKAKDLRLFYPGVLSKARHSKKKEQVEVVCRVSLWVKGERVTRESSTPVKLPVTQDPVVRKRCVFTLPRENLQHAAIIVKMLYTSKWTNEDILGRVQLGPLLYLGTSPEEAASACPPPDYNTSITLSHWGLALKTSGPVTLWHQLQF